MKDFLQDIDEIRLRIPRPFRVSAGMRGENVNR